jgi:anti-sigma B factor antagonist
MCSAAVPGLGASNDERSSASSFVLHAIRAHVAEGEPDAGELRIRISRPANDLCVLSLSGEMDMSNASELIRALGGNIGSGRMIIELSRLTFMDSTGIKQLVELSRTVNAAGGAIVLAAPHPNLARLFEIVNLGKLMPVVASLEVAIDGTSETAPSPELAQGHQAIAGPGRNCAPETPETQVTDLRIAQYAHAVSLRPESGADHENCRGAEREPRAPYASSSTDQGSADQV